MPRRLLLILLGIFLSAESAGALRTDDYCADITAYPALGRLYVEVVWDPFDRSKDATIRFLKGKLEKVPVRAFSGAWDAVLGRYVIVIENDTVMDPGEFELEVTSSEIKGYDPSSGTQILSSTSGGCEINFEEDFCAYSLSQHYTFDIGSHTTGSSTVPVDITPYPVGSTTSVTADVESDGLSLDYNDPVTGETFNLTFLNVDDDSGTAVNTAFVGKYRKATGFPLAQMVGFRNPVKLDPSSSPLTGCEGIRLFAKNSPDFDYGTPTIVGNKLYIGSANGGNHQATTDHFFARIDLSTMLPDWTIPLGGKEVRGSAVLDSAGDIYFVTEEGRTQVFVAGKADGDHSGSTVRLTKVSNPPFVPGTIQWEEDLVSGGTTGIEIPGTGQMTPAITAGDTIVVGGYELRAYSSSGGTPTMTYSDVTDMHIWSSPLIYDDAGTEYAIFHGKEGIYSVNVSTGALQWSHKPGILSEVYSSPQFNAAGDMIFSALYSTLFCYDPATGYACAGWSAASSSSPPDACDLNISGKFRASPIVDHNGDYLIGTKDNSSSVYYKVDAAQCSVDTAAAGVGGSYETWSYSTGADVYPTSIITDQGRVVVGTEYVNDGIIKFLNYSTGAVEESYHLNGDMGFSSFRIHHVNPNESYLVGSIDEGFEFLPGVLFAIPLFGENYQTKAENPTLRGNNIANGQIP